MISLRLHYRAEMSQFFNQEKIVHYYIEQDMKSLQLPLPNYFDNIRLLILCHIIIKRQSQQSIAYCLSYGAIAFFTSQPFTHF